MIDDTIIQMIIAFIAAAWTLFQELRHRINHGRTLPGKNIYDPKMPSDQSHLKILWTVGSLLGLAAFGYLLGVIF